jgi:hypothetical protein
VTFWESIEHSELPKKTGKPVEQVRRENFNANFTGIPHGDSSGAHVDTHEHVDTHPQAHGDVPGEHTDTRPHDDTGGGDHVDGPAAHADVPTIFGHGDSSSGHDDTSLPHVDGPLPHGDSSLPHWDSSTSYHDDTSLPKHDDTRAHGDTPGVSFTQLESLAEQTINQLKTIAISTAGEIQATAIRDAMAAAKISEQALNGIEAGSRLAISYLEEGAEEIVLIGEEVIEWVEEHACVIGIGAALGTVFALIVDAPDPETIAEDAALTAPLTAAVAAFLATGEKAGGEFALGSVCDTTATLFVDFIWAAVSQWIGSENKELLIHAIAGSLEDSIEAASATYMVPVVAATVVAGIVTSVTTSFVCEHKVPSGTTVPKGNQPRPVPPTHPSPKPIIPPITRKTPVDRPGHVDVNRPDHVDVHDHVDTPRHVDTHTHPTDHIDTHVKFPFGNPIHDDTAIPGVHHDASLPHDDISSPHDDTSLPHDDTSLPHDDTPARRLPTGGKPTMPISFGPINFHPIIVESTAPKGVHQVWISGKGNSEWSNSKVITGDLQGSGTTDIAILYDYGKSQAGLWLFSNGSNFQPSRPWVTSPGNWDCTKSVEVLAGNFTGSGKTDLAVFYNYSNTFTGLWLFKSDNHFQPIRAWCSFPGKWPWIQSNTALSGNFRGSGNTDIAVFYDYGKELLQTGLWLFGSESNFQPRMVWDSGPRNWDWSQSKAIACDFKGSGKTEIAVFYNYGGSHTRLWLFDSEHNFEPYCLWDSGPGNFSWSNIVKVIAGDFTGSGKTDIAVFYDQGDNQQSLWLISSEYNFKPHQVWEATGWARPVGVISGDFSGSGKTDIAAFFNYGNDAMWLWKFSSDSNFNATSVWQSGIGELDWSRVIKVVTGNFTDPEKTDIALLYYYPNSETGLWILPTQKAPSQEIFRDSIPVPGRRIHPIGMDLRM